MKNLFIFCVLLNVAYLNAQSMSEFKSTIGNGSKKVQAIHKYPKDIGDGECHFVEVTSIVIEGDRITIVETWKSFWGKAKTTLTGKINGTSVSGNWQSSFSSGTWSYDFKKNIGEWNKTNSNMPTFTKMEYLRFEIVNNNEIKDGHFSCR